MNEPKAKHNLYVIELYNWDSFFTHGILFSLLLRHPINLKILCLPLMQVAGLVFLTISFNQKIDQLIQNHAAGKKQENDFTLLISNSGLHRQPAFCHCGKIYEIIDFRKREGLFLLTVWKVAVYG